MKTADFLRQHDACEDGAKWALSISDDMADVWEAMIKEGKHEWLIWTATRPGVFPESTLRRLACRFVRETPVANGRTVWDLLTDERSRKAVEVAERYTDGKATESELSAADSYAADAIAVAAHSAGAAASYAAHAAHAASYAAWAADCAAAIAVAADTAGAAASYAARAAARAAADTDHAAAFYAARADADAAQIRMVTELGNPFKEGKTK